MNITKRTGLALMTCLALLLTALALPIQAESAAWQVGDQAAGFVVTELTRMDLVNADVTLMTHEKTGAVVMLLRNEDTNRVFDISFRTPIADDTGVPHVFEHATLNGSEKYPSRTLFFNLMYQTYNTFMNAMTGPQVTTYPTASLSEAQLLKYADFYTDSVFNPMILRDESIFREEAWRYALADKDAPLEMLGTVYSEMSGSYELNTAGFFDFRATLFPGSQAGYYFAGKPDTIPKMSWQHLKDFHNAWYHPSNSLTILYGNLEDPEAFLQLLDGYFSAYERKEFDYADAGYTPLTAPQAATAQFPVEAGSDTANSSVVFYGFALADATLEDRSAMDLLSVLLDEASSPFQQAVKQQLPGATAECMYDDLTPEPALYFRALGINPEDADTFRGIVDNALAGIIQNGFDLAAVEAVAAANRLELLLSTEGANVGVDIILNVAFNWASSGGDPMAFAHYVDNTANYLPFAEQGVYQQLLQKLTTDNPRTAMLTISPAPGLKEEQDAALAEKLAGIKAEMSEQQIEEIVAATAALSKKGEQEGQPAGEQSDADQYVAQLQAVQVNTLPEERRTYQMADQTGEDGVRRMHAQADVSGVGQALLLLDAGALPQEDLHWYKLYTDLVGKLDTAQHDNAALTALITRYLHALELRPSVYGGEKGDQMLPKLRVSWIAMDEDMAPAYDLVYELLYDTQLDDATKVANVVGQVKNALKQTITQGPYQVQIYRAFAYDSPRFQYFNYLTWLDYYAFLEQAETLFESDPQAALDKLAAVQAHLHAHSGAISAFAGSDESASAHRATADAFLQRLDSVQRQPVAYDLPAIQQREGLVVDTAVYFNTLYAPNKMLGMEQTSGELDALSALLTDKYLLPQLREQYGAYGVQHVATEDGVVILSFMDPNIQETFDVYAAAADALEAMPLDQETVDGYILAAYSNYTLSQGELSGALAALVDTLEGRAPELYLTWMKQLKGLTPEKIKAYAGMYRTMNEQGHRSTVGGAGALNARQDNYDVILNPFQMKETSPAEAAFTDVPEDAWYKEAAQFAAERKLIEPLADGTFGAEEPATLGDLANALFAMAGMPLGEEQGFATLQMMGAAGEQDTVDTPMTREKMAHTLYSFLLVAAGDELKSELAELPDTVDAGDITPEYLEGVQFLVAGDRLHLLEGNRVAPKEPATRADLAHMFWIMEQED